MPMIRPISDLRNSANEISDFCRQTREPVYITRNGTGDTSGSRRCWICMGNWLSQSERLQKVQKAKIS